MKFGRRLLEEEDSAPLEYKESWIKYKSLKKYLKFRLLNNEVNGNAVGQDAMEKEKEFLRLIYTQLKEVDRCFEREARKVLSTYELQTAQNKCMAQLAALLTCQRGSKLKDPMELALKARWCRHYAELNYLALRKIAKKRDRLLGGSVGEEFMLACLRGEVNARAFMSASLLAELAAIETIMTERAVQMEKKQQQVLPSSQGLEQSLTVVDEAATTPPTAIIEEGVEVDRDHTCAVCLDLLYQPVSLSCGHVFCSRCALASAVGHQRLIGNAEQLLLSAACYSTDKPCPCCRTALFGKRREKHSPFYDIKRMSRLEHLIRQKYPEEWKRRKEEDAAEQAALKAQRPTAWQSLKHIVVDAIPN